MKGMRNRIAHGYFDINLAIVWATARTAMPELLARLPDIMAERQLSFDEIAPLVDRTPTATRQLASRARRRVRGRAPEPDPDLVRQREVVDAFFAAAREGDFDALVAVLHPDATFRATGLGPVPFVLEGAATVASNARAFGPTAASYAHTIVNGAAGVITTRDGRLASITAFTVVDGRVFAIDVLADPDRLREYDLADF